MFGRNEINSEELMTLLAKRANGEADFILIDVREPIEYRMGYIDGVDILKPTSLFREWAPALIKDFKDKTLIFTCRIGNRSGQIVNIFQANGHSTSINHRDGIASYDGKIVRPI